MAEFGELGSECCGCCRACAVCWNHALCRQIARGLNYFVPGLCPIKETDRVWGAVSGRHVRASCRAYIAREHSVTGIFFAPTSRPTDLHKVQLLLTFFLGLVVALYLSMLFSEAHPDWMNTIWEWIPILAINSIASFTKICYKSGLKRTYYCVLQFPGLVARGLKVSTGEGFFFKKQPAKAVYMGLRLGLSKVQATMTWSSEAHAWISDPSQELRLPLKYEALEVAVLQVLQDGTEQVIGRAEHEISKLSLEPGSRVAMSLDLGPGNSGKLEFLLCVERDEPIAALDFFLSLIRPLTDCVVLRCCCLVLCLPCACCCWRRSRRSKSSASPKAATVRSSRSSGLPGTAWRGVLRILGVALVASAAIHITVLLLLSENHKVPHKLVAAATLFLKAKLFGWFVTEPGALLWTYCTMRSFCPTLLPQQSLEQPREPAPAVVVEPIAILDHSKLQRPLMGGASSPRKQQAGNCALQ